MAALALVLAAVSIAISIAAIRVLAKLGDRMQGLSDAMAAQKDSFEQLSALAEPLPTRASPLEGRRIGLHIEQDHQLPILFRLVQERLQAEDATIIPLDSKGIEELASTAKWEPGVDRPHAIVHGTLHCNNYRDVYFDADLTFLFSQGVVESILESPANGARQANLAISIVKVLKQTMERETTRAERMDALRELGSP